MREKATATKKLPISATTKTNKMKNTILIIIFSFLTTTAFSQEIKNVAVILPFDNDNVANGYETYLQGQLTQVIIQEEGYKAFTRTDINAIIDEHRFQETGMVNDNERQKIGQMTGATHICVSQFTGTNDNITITAQIINIETGEIEIIVNQNTDNKNIKDVGCSMIIYYLNKYLQPNHSVTSYNNTSEAINFINERLLTTSISIDNKGNVLGIHGNAKWKFKIQTVGIAYNCRDCDIVELIEHYVNFFCDNCIRENGKKINQQSFSCKTKKDAQDVVKAFQFIQSKF